MSPLSSKNQNIWNRPFNRLGCFALMILAPFIPITCALQDAKQDLKKKEHLEKLHQAMNSEEFEQVKPKLEKTINE